MEYRTNRKRDKDGLLHQDRAVMELLLQGKSRQKIVKELDMPLGTVNTCCTRLYKQFGVNNIMELLIKYRDTEGTVKSATTELEETI